MTGNGEKITVVHSGGVKFGGRGTTDTIADDVFSYQLGNEN